METTYILCGLTSGILAIIAKAKWSELKFIGKAALIFSIIGLLAGAVYAYNQNKKEERQEKINATYGNISNTGSISIPKFAFGFTKGSPIIQDYKTGILMFEDKPILTVYIKNNKLCVTTVIKDSTGEPIVSIMDSEWTKYNDAYEFNYDDNGLELVTKGEREVFFHLKLSEGIVYLEGTLYIAKDLGLDIFEGTGENKGWNGYKILGIDSYPDRRHMKRLFKYPRERYLGVRD